MKIFVYRVNDVYLIYYQDDIYEWRWRLIIVKKCPIKKVTYRFIRAFTSFVSNAPKGSIGKPSFFYENSPTAIYTLVQSYNIISRRRYYECSDL
jgi:hypothetical protein